MQHHISCIGTPLPGKTGIGFGIHPKSQRMIGYRNGIFQTIKRISRINHLDLYIFGFICPGRRLCTPFETNCYGSTAFIIKVTVGQITTFLSAYDFPIYPVIFTFIPNITITSAVPFRQCRHIRTPNQVRSLRTNGIHCRTVTKRLYAVHQCQESLGCSIHRL